MFISLVLIILFITVLYKYVDYKTQFYPGIPDAAQSFPVIRHLHFLFGNNVRLHKSLQVMATMSLENDGCVIFSWGPVKNLILADPEDTITLLNSNPEKLYIYSFAKYWLGNGILVADGKTWTANRKVIYPMFGQQYLNNFMPIFNKQAKKVVERFSSKVGEGPFEHDTDIMVTGLETICQTALGADVGEQLTANKDYVEAIDGQLTTVTNRFKRVWLHYTPFFEMSSLKKTQDKHMIVIDKLSKELVQKRKSQFNPELKCVENKSGEIRPFIDVLLKAQLENSEFTDKQIRDEINTLVATGYETTATALTYCLMLLGHHQHVQLRACKEIEEVFEGSDRDVDKTDLAKLVYLDAVIKESLRMYPIIPTIGRTVTRSVKLRKYEVKAGAYCFISIYGLHRHPQWGPDADQYRPERWLHPETLPKNPNLFAPFGLGKRYCIGQTYGMMAMKTTLVHVLRRYKVKSDISKLVLKLTTLSKPHSGHQISLELRNV